MSPTTVAEAHVLRHRARCIATECTGYNLNYEIDECCRHVSLPCPQNGRLGCFILSALESAVARVWSKWDLSDGSSCGHTTFRFSADVLPLLGTSSYSTVCPSLRVLKPAFSTAEMWTKTSLPPPPEGWINPYPLVGLNHFTVPLAILKLRCWHETIWPMRKDANRDWMSAFGGKADIGWCTANVRFWPKADITVQVTAVTPQTGLNRSLRRASPGDCGVCRSGPSNSKARDANSVARERPALQVSECGMIANALMFHGAEGASKKGVPANVWL